MSELGKVMRRLMEIARKGDAATCAEPIACVTRQMDGLRSESRFGDLAITIDEPVSFGGTGTAPNPAEVALAALGASLEVTLRCYAEYFEIGIESITVKLDGMLDNRGFFGTDPAVRPGFSKVGARICVKSNASRADIKKLLEHVDRFCPILDLFRARTPVTLGWAWDE